MLVGAKFLILNVSGSAPAKIVFSNPKMSLKAAKGRRSGFYPFGF
jgi:hypothetical protein